MAENLNDAGTFFIKTDEKGRIQISFSGNWTIKAAVIEENKILKELGHRLVPGAKVMVNASSLQAWDSIFISALIAVKDFLENKDVAPDFTDLPDGALHMLQLASSSPDAGEISATGMEKRFLERVGKTFQSYLQSVRDFHRFLGEVVLGLAGLFTGHTRIRAKDFFLYLQNAGAEALPIVSMVSFLVGLILAFVATVQLKLFGAQIYVADLVGIAMARDMGAMMCGIIMAGRTGATYAAQLGTMQVNEEIDAFKTFGINPVNFLVVPRILALGFMMPFLCIYADLLGIAGGAVVGAGFSDITLQQYINETQVAVSLSQFFIGIVKCFIYGLIVALVGCQKGLSSGRSAAAVGRVTTSAVVTSIVWIIITCAVITIICYILDI